MTSRVLQKLAKNVILTSAKQINQRKVPSRNGCIICKTRVPFFEEPSIVFSKEAVCHHWGALPIIFITLGGFTCEMLYIIRQSFTRDDVWYTKDPVPCEKVETREGYPAPIRKFRTYNQKYKFDPELIDAIQGRCRDCGDKKKKEGESGEGGAYAIIGAHAAVSAAAIIAASTL